LVPTWETLSALEKSTPPPLPGSPSETSILLGENGPVRSWARLPRSPALARVLGFFPASIAANRKPFPTTRRNLSGPKVAAANSCPRKERDLGHAARLCPPSEEDKRPRYSANLESFGASFEAAYPEAPAKGFFSPARAPPSGFSKEGLQMLQRPRRSRAATLFYQPVGRSPLQKEISPRLFAHPPAPAATPRPWTLSRAHASRFKKKKDYLRPALGKSFPKSPHVFRPPRPGRTIRWSSVQCVLLRRFEREGKRPPAAIFPAMNVGAVPRFDRSSLQSLLFGVRLLEMPPTLYGDAPYPGSFSSVAPSIQLDFPKFPNAGQLLFSA